MKAVIISFLFLFTLSTSLSAGENSWTVLGPKGGIVWSNFFHNEEVTDTDPAKGYTGGLFYFSMPKDGKGSMFQSGIQYTRKGATLSHANYDEEILLHYIELPLTFKGMFMKFISGESFTTSLTIHGGGFAAYKLAESHSFTSTNGTLPLPFETDIKQSFDAGLMFGGGLTGAAGNVMFFAEASIYLGLLKLDDMDKETGPRLRNADFRVEFGIGKAF